MQLILITHAHTLAVADAAADVWRLSPAGEAQAARLAQAVFWPHVSRVVVSSEPKARLTVAGVCQARGLPVWVDARFDELRRSGWVEGYADAVTAVLAQPQASLHGWEPASQALQRGLDGLAALQLRCPGETVALVGHGIQLSLLRAHLLGRATVDPGEWAALRFAAHARVDLAAGRIVEDFALSEQSRGRA